MAASGFVITGPSYDCDLQDARELWAIYVDPQRWGIGIGRLLMATARDRLYQDGAREALLWVLAGNNRARRFYQLDGWNCDGFRRTEVIGGVTTEELRTALSAPPPLSHRSIEMSTRSGPRVVSLRRLRFVKSRGSLDPLDSQAPGRELADRDSCRLISKPPS